MIKSLLSCGVIGACVCAGAAVKPNILFILADDAGYNDFGFYNQTEEYHKATPVLDKLRSESVFFSQAYVSGNVCAPSRAGILTGLHQQRFGFRDNFPKHWGTDSDPRWENDGWREFGVDPSVKTVGYYLQKVGYYTGIVGKWHLGYDDKFHPTNRGFDYFYGLRTGSRSFFPIKEFKQGEVAAKYQQLEKNGVFQPENKINHVTETFGDASIEFIDEAKKAKKPFYLFLSHTAPHSPLQSDPQSLALAKKLFPKADKMRQQYMGLIIGMDRSIGRVLDHVKKLGMEKNTMVIFMSDNGGSAKNSSNNGILRGHKWCPFEGGYRVPMLIKWPGEIKPNSSNDTAVISLDLIPTYVTAAGGKTAKGLDGVALQPLFKKKKLDKRTLCWWDYNGEGVTSTIVQHPWKLITRVDDENAKPKGKSKKKKQPAGNVYPMLFNLDKDLSETKNLADQYPEMVQKMNQKVEAWKDTLPEKMNW